ncbi:MAG TPA: hypothetical protein VFB04_04910 [Terriglobales bacterium]|nr:hypothetical protein [Terriglobales bacterium]
MSIIRRSRQGLKTLLFGDTLLPQEFTVGMVEPNSEITLWLHGGGEPVDVTRRWSTACSEPFRLCISFPDDQAADLGNGKQLSLKFCERAGQKRVLGEIGLQPVETITVAGSTIVLFSANRSTNYCLPIPRLYAHYLMQAYSLKRSTNGSGMHMTFLERKVAMVTFIRPHPVRLGSLDGVSGGNIFPMNIMGELGEGYVAFALKDSRRPAHLVEDAGRLAISSVPLSQAPVAFKLAANHFKDFIAWEEVPFRTINSQAFGIPVPEFTQRIQELEVTRVHRIGSHTLFIARIVRDERLRDEPELCVIHGFYQSWRLRERCDDVNKSLLNDAMNKGLCVQR